MEKVWLQQYDPGVPADIDPEHYSSIVEIFEQSAQKYVDQTAFINMGFSISFKKLDEQSRHFAAYLQNAGLKKGDAVAIMMPNLLQYPVALFGVLRAGMVVVNVNPLYTARELKHQLNDASAKAIVIVENFAATLQCSIFCLSHYAALLRVLRDGQIFATMLSAITNGLKSAVCYQTLFLSMIRLLAPFHE